MMPQEGRTQSSGNGAFVELRDSIASIAGELKDVAEARSRAAKEYAGEGVESLRTAIRRQPAVAMGLALLAGAALAIIAVPRLGRRTPARWAGWVPSISRADLYDVAQQAQRGAMRAANSVPVASWLERLADAFARMEPSSALNSTIEKIGAWFDKMRGRGTA